MEITLHKDSLINSAPASELDSLRSQMNALRSRLDSQQLVSDSLLRDVVRRSTEFSRRYFKLEKFLVLPIGVISLIFMYLSMGVPLWFVILTCLMLLGEVVWDWRITRIANVDYGRTPLIEIQERLIRQKRLRSRRMLAGMIILAVWLPLFVLVIIPGMAPEIAQSGAEPDTASFRGGVYIGAAVGGIIGLYIGLSSYFRMQRENAASIQRLREYTDR